MIRGGRRRVSAPALFLEMKKRARTAVLFLLGIGAAHTACSVTRPSKSTSPERVVLTNSRETVTYPANSSFYFRWEIEHRADSTRAVTAAGSESIPVQIVDGNDTHLWLESKSWNSVKKIPPGYSKEKTIRFSRRKDRVQVGLPITSLTEVSIDIDQQIPRKKSGTNIIQNFISGARNGFVYAIEEFGDKSEVSQETDPLDPLETGEYRDREAALGLLGLGILGGTLGAVGYPIYDVVKTTKEVSFRKKYPLAGSDGFRLKIITR